MSETGFTGAHNGIYYKNGAPVCAVSQLGNLSPGQQKLVSMPALQPKEPAPASKQKKKVVRRRKKNSTTKAKQSTTPTQPKKPIPASSVQPRDRLGRFASKAGSLLWGATKGTARAVAGTVKVGKKVHKGVQAHQKQQKRRANIELRERAVAVAEREQQLRGKKKKVVRRKR